jgi:hypothetical protein
MVECRGESREKFAQAVVRSDGKVRFGSGSEGFSLNPESEPGVRFKPTLNLEPERGVQVQRVRLGVQRRSNAELNAFFPLPGKKPAARQKTRLNVLWEQ